MACPYFYPESRLGMKGWAVPVRCPLGDLYSGHCCSLIQDFSPDETTLRKFCNFGYGRGGCSRFPSDAQTDAVRFQMAGEFGNLLRVHYVREKDGWPSEYGTVEFSTATNEFAAAPADEILRRQAAVFIESYRRRKMQ